MRCPSTKSPPRSLAKRSCSATASGAGQQSLSRNTSRVPAGAPSSTSTAAESTFLQASLFTSVVAFGVAAMAVVVGIVLALFGLAIRDPAAT